MLAGEGVLPHYSKLQVEAQAPIWSPLTPCCGRNDSSILLGGGGASGSPWVSGDIRDLLAPTHVPFMDTAGGGVGGLLLLEGNSPGFSPWSLTPHQQRWAGMTVTTRLGRKCLLPMGLHFRCGHGHHYCKVGMKV